MDPISIVLAALAAGATAGVTKGAGEAVTAAFKDSYAGLRTALGRLFAGRPNAAAAADAVERFDADPEAYTETVAVQLRRAGAEQDAALLAAAQAVLTQVDGNEVRVGKYVVNLRDAQGVQIGDHNTQTNNFG